MRSSLTARFISRPAIVFGIDHGSGRRRRLGIGGGATRYYRPLHARQTAPTVAVLRSLTSQFRFPSVGRVGPVGSRRGLLPLGLPRARRA